MASYTKKIFDFTQTGASLSGGPFTSNSMVHEISVLITAVGDVGTSWTANIFGIGIATYTVTAGNTVNDVATGLKNAIDALVGVQGTVSTATVTIKGGDAGATAGVNVTPTVRPSNGGAYTMTLVQQHTWLANPQRVADETGIFQAYVEVTGGTVSTATSVDVKLQGRLDPDAPWVDVVSFASGWATTATATQTNTSTVLFPEMRILLTTFTGSGGTTSRRIRCWLME
jgi:hypothetical protein